MKESIRPIGDRVLVLPDESPNSTPGGIILPDAAKEKPARGKVVAVGNGSPSKVLMFNYPSGDVESKLNAERNAAKIQGALALTSPRNPQGNWEAVEHVDGPSYSNLKVGDVVLHSKYAGSEVEINGVRHIVLREDDVLGVVTVEKESNK